MARDAELTDLQRNKLLHRFRMLDMDRNGYIERMDYEQLARRLVGGAGLRPDDSKARKLTSALTGIFDALAVKMDADGDGRISSQEWLSSVTDSVIRRGRFDQVIGPAAHAVFDAFDSDGNGELTIDELRVFLTATGTGDAGATEALRHIDTDHSGSISHDEFIQVGRDFYTSADPDVPGNWLYGNPGTAQR